VKNAPGTSVKNSAARLRPVALAGVLATAAAALPAQAAAAAPAAGAAGHGQVSTLCRRYQHVAVLTAQGTHFVVKNDNYGGQRECLTVRGERPDFTVAQSHLPTWHAKPQAYPFILRGCSWGTCSAPDSSLSRQVSALRQPVATWHTTQVPDGEWDAAFDTWFGTRPMTTGQADGAEWLDRAGLVAGEHRGRIRAVAGRHRAGHRLVLGPGLVPRPAPGPGPRRV
jgi:hypothetical protein